MPNDALITAIKEAYASAPVDEVILHTLEIIHSSFTTPIRVVQDRAGHTLVLEEDAPVNPGEAVEFIGYAFDFRLPSVGESSSPEIEISIDNISRDIMANLEVATQSSMPVRIIYRPYLASDPSAPQMNPPLDLQVSNARVTLFQITFRAGFGDIASRKFPNEFYTTERFPGLVS